MYPQPRLGTRYEESLKRRFEKADQVFSEIYLRKARLDKKGLRAYTAVELRQDLCAAAFGHGLCAEALMAYFQVLHWREILRRGILRSSQAAMSDRRAVTYAPARRRAADDDNAFFLAALGRAAHAKNATN